MPLEIFPTTTTAQKLEYNINNMIKTMLVALEPIKDDKVNRTFCHTMCFLQCTSMPW